MQAGEVNNGYFHTLDRKKRKESSKFVINRAIFGDRSGPLDLMSDVFPNLSFVASLVTSATLSRESLFCCQCLGGKKALLLQAYIVSANFTKMKMRGIYNVHRALSYFFPFSTLFSIFLSECLLFPFLPQYIFSEPLSSLVTQVYQNRNQRALNQHL